MTSLHHFRGGRPRTALAVAATLLLGTACASRAPPPTDQMSVARAAVDAANTGAQGYAPSELRLANEKLAMAQKAMLAKDHDAALRYAQQAQADAQLAVSKTHATNARIAADQALSAARSPAAAPTLDAPRTGTGSTR